MENCGTQAIGWRCDKHALEQNSTTKACLHPPQIVVPKEQLFASRWKKLRSLLIQNFPKFVKKPFWVCAWTRSRKVFSGLLAKWWEILQNKWKTQLSFLISLRLLALFSFFILLHDYKVDNLSIIFFTIIMHVWYILTKISPKNQEFFKNRT